MVGQKGGVMPFLLSSELGTTESSRRNREGSYAYIGALFRAASRRRISALLRKRRANRGFGVHREDEVHAALNAGGNVERRVAVRVLVVPDFGTRATLGEVGRHFRQMLVSGAVHRAVA